MAPSSHDMKLLRRVLELGHRLETLWPAHLSAAPEPTAMALLESLRTAMADCGDADSDQLRRLAGHQGHLSLAMTGKHLGAVLVPFERLSGRSLRDDEFLVREGDRLERGIVHGPLVIVADCLRSAFNVGAIFRTAECFAAKEIWLTGYTPTPDDAKTARTSMGASQLMPWRHIPKAAAALDSLKSDGYAVIALETAATAEEIGAFHWPEKPALVLGNERFGLDLEILRKADHVLRIPVHGQKNSLNVGIAFGIALHDWRQQFDEGSRRARRSATTRPPLENETANGTDSVPELRPIGSFRSRKRSPYEALRQGSVDRSGEIGWVELRSRSQFEQALPGLETFDRIWLLYRFHHNTNWKPMVLPIRGPRVKRGVFATRSPYRPNPLGLSCVELVKVDGLRIYVKGFDLLDGTPIYDIKPYLAYSDAFPEAGMGWLEGVDDSRYSIEFAQEVETGLQWLEHNGVIGMRPYIISQLEFNPLDRRRKRVSRRLRRHPSARPSNAQDKAPTAAGGPDGSDGPEGEQRPEDASADPAGHYKLAYRTWRVLFHCNATARVIRVLAIESGYTAGQLALPDDPQQDKHLHRRFMEIFGV